MRVAPESSPRKLFVCLVEYNPLAARTLERLLADDSGLGLLSHHELLENPHPPKTTAAVFVLDRATLPAPLSHYLRFLRLRFPRARTLLLDEALATEDLCRLLLLGIHGFLAYDDVEPHLSQAVRAVATGHLWVGAEVLEQYVRYTTELSRLKGKKGGIFTLREKRILALVQRRLANKEIGSILGISESTVKFHLGNIFAKLGVHDRHAVVEVASARSLQVLLPQKST